MKSGPSKPGTSARSGQPGRSAGGARGGDAKRDGQRQSHEQHPAQKRGSAGPRTTSPQDDRKQQAPRDTKKRQGAPRKPADQQERGGERRHGHQHGRAEHRKRGEAQQREQRSNELWLYGLHAVAAALANRRRTCHQLLATEEAMQKLGPALKRHSLRITPAAPEEIGRRLPRGAVHQGVALHVAPLAPLQLERVIAVQPEESLLLALDQVTDPHNLGAILRSAAAMGVQAVIVPERRSAELAGTTAKAASGALDMLPVVEVTNLSRALESLKKAGFFVTGLDGSGTKRLEEADRVKRRVLVVGSEGDGIRRLVGEACDEVLKIGIERRIDSLNVSVATGVALYALRLAKGVA